MTQTLIYAEIDLRRCANTYGVAPCTASIPATGVRKCYQARPTCQDIDNYVDASVLTLRFAKPTHYRPADIFAFPFIKDVQFTPAVVSLGKDLGQRASIVITFEDAPDSDTFTGLDPYLSSRDYDPYSQGTFFGKLRARHTFMVGRPLRLISGYVGQELADMETRHFLIDSYEGPTPDGKFTIRASDVLKLGNADKAMAPAMSPGALVASITSSDTSFTLTPTGSGTSYPEHSGWLNIGGSEIVAFEHDPTAGNDANCLLLLLCNGSDASTTFTDSSSSARTVTANGNAQLDTADKKFGTASALFDGTGDYLSVPDNAAWTQAGDFCVDCWVKFNTLQDFRAIFSHGTDGNNKYQLYCSATGDLRWEVNSAGVSIVFMQSAAGVITDATWHHVALERVGTVWSIYVDGVSVATTTDASAIPDFTGTFKIGMDQDGSSNPFKGWIDVFRFSNVARFTAAFDTNTETGPYAASADTMFITRAQLNTTAAAHSAGDRAQLVLAYVGEDPADIIYDLCVNYITGFDADWIDLDAWQTETATYNGNVYTSYICEPTSVKQLIEEIVLQAALAIWWDDVNQLLRLQVLRAISTSAFEYTTDNMRRGTLAIREQLEQRLSQVQIYFAQINPLLPLSNKDNYRSSVSVEDEDATADWVQPAITTILSRWIPQAGSTVAERLAAILLGRFKTPPRHVSFEVQRYAGTDPEVGGGYKFSCGFVQDETGATEGVSIPIQVTQLKVYEDRIAVESEEMLFDAPAADLADRAVTFGVNAFNINLRTEHDSIYPEPDGTETVTFTIQSGVTIGSHSASLPAIDVGTWPAGTTINIVVEGRIQGMGGLGGTGGVLPSANGGSGSAGGTALYTRRAISLTNNSEIFGGGGGGGGGGGLSFGGTAGGGGGGGAGTDGGSGGAGGSAGAGSGAAGATGTSEAGGAGGAAGGAGSGAGGAGGGPGLSGSAGAAGAGSTGGSGAAAGAAVDGHSYVTYTAAGDIRGGQVN